MKKIHGKHGTISHHRRSFSPGLLSRRSLFVLERQDGDVKYVSILAKNHMRKHRDLIYRRGYGLKAMVRDALVRWKELELSKL